MPTFLYTENNNTIPHHVTAVTCRGSESSSIKLVVHIPVRELGLVKVRD